ncbi:MAG: hypothetical protein HC782_02485 [Gammaproteobacteria bacterium]|nr:hypothetical protein [Gammaproteobacteria bacterium]
MAWVNNTFDPLMPNNSQVALGAVPYAKSSAFQSLTADTQPAVNWHWIFEDKEVPASLPSAVTEANTVVHIIRAAQTANSRANISILVRNRTHLADIIPALKKANCHFQAVDIDPLRTRPIVEDLFALTRAISHLADRIAWLAVLRAPWCGLTLNDLAALTNSATPINNAITPDARTLWEMLHDSKRLAALSEDGQARLIACRHVMHAALSTRHQMSLRDVVENTWLRLKGPACLDSQDALADAKMFLDLLHTCAVEETGGSQLIDISSLERRMDRLFSGNHLNTESEHPAVAIMTIHKAKGLEFDVVIVPGLHRTPRMSSKTLLAWSDDINADTGERELLLAPIRETGEEEKSDSIYDYIAKRDREKQRHEDVRLMYVAATRAVATLHLLAMVNVTTTEEAPTIVTPKSASLLAAIWPSVAAVAEDHVLTPRHIELAESSETIADNVVALGNVVSTPHALRLTSNAPWPTMPNTIASATTDTNSLLSRDKHDMPGQFKIDFDWTGEAARQIGIIVHMLLQVIAEDGLDKWPQRRIDECRTQFQQALIANGVALNQIDNAVSRICRALENTLADARGRWLLCAHKSAQSEWRLTGLHDGKLINIVIDRSFIDDNGVRWIIDFKTGEHLGSDSEAFLDNEVSRYAMQLNTYATLVAAMSPTQTQTPIKCGLYFPLMGEWREWEWVRDWKKL